MIVEYGGQRSKPAIVINANKKSKNATLDRITFGSNVWAKQYLINIGKANKGVYDRWRVRAFQMAAMRERRTANGLRNSWRQIGIKFGVDPVNAYKSVKLHNARVGKNADGEPIQRDLARLTQRAYGPMVRSSATNEGSRP